MSLDMFFQHFFNALTLGSLYGLIAIGYTMRCRILRLIQLRPRRHPSSLRGLFRVLRHHDVFPALRAAVVVVAIPRFSAVGFWWTASPTGLRDAPHFRAHPSAIAVSFFIESLSVVVFRTAPPGSPAGWLMTPINLGHLKLLPLTLVVPVVSFALVLGLLWIIYRTKLRPARHAGHLRDIETTRLLGVRVDPDHRAGLRAGLRAENARPRASCGRCATADQPLHGHLPGFKAFIAAVLRGHRVHSGRDDRRNCCSGSSKS